MLNTVTVTSVVQSPITVVPFLTAVTVRLFTSELTVATAATLDVALTVKSVANVRVAVPSLLSTKVAPAGNPAANN